MESSAFVREYLRDAAEAVAASPVESLTEALELLMAAYRRGSRTFCCGNGGSAANASHLACDLAKFTAHPERPRFLASSLCDNAALLSALTNDVGFGHIFSEQLVGTFGRGDVLICLSVHGGSGRDKAGPWSQNLLTAAELAKERGGHVLDITGYDGGALLALADVSIIVPRTAAGVTSTPHVEGIHEIYHHLLCEGLRRRIAQEPERVPGG